jgi:hypothetical protein
MHFHVMLIKFVPATFDLREAFLWAEVMAKCMKGPTVLLYQQAIQYTTHVLVCAHLSNMSL